MKRRTFIAQGLGGAVAAHGLTGCQPPPPADMPGSWVGSDPQRAHAVLVPRPDGAAGSTAQPFRGGIRRVPVLVAGGGVAGLAAARALMQSGMDDLALLEHEDEAGGNARAGGLKGLSCPWGAHYLPVPGADQPELQAMLADFGLLHRDAAGRWQPEERHLCHSPQERLWFNGHWQAGLLPMDGVGPDTLAQYRRFGTLVERVRRKAVAQGSAFRVPQVGHMQLQASLAKSRLAGYQPFQPLSPDLLELDALVFADWLARQNLNDPHLQWYLDYVCRDEYGAGCAQVSAWAGLHYFAARHGFALPGEAEPGHAVFTWPEGNAFLTRRMAAPLGDRLHTGWTVQQVAIQRSGVEVDAVHTSGERVRWLARHVVLALPAHVLPHVLPHTATGASQGLRQRALGVQHAAWVVTNLHVAQPLLDRGGAAPAWDNVAYGAQGLGYIDANHQALHRPPHAPTVLTHYRALGPGLAVRQALRDSNWRQWVDSAVSEWQEAHPELRERTTVAAVARHGHGMVVPVPGFLSGLNGLPGVGVSALHWAHSDASGMSTFEEAFAQGTAAGLEVIRADRQGFSRG